MKRKNETNLSPQTTKKSKSSQKNLCHSFFSYQTNGNLRRQDRLNFINVLLSELLKNMEKNAEDIIVFSYEGYKASTPIITNKNVEQLYQELLASYESKQPVAYIEFLRYQNQAVNYLLQKGDFKTLLNLARDKNRHVLFQLCDYASLNIQNSHRIDLLKKDLNSFYYEDAYLLAKIDVFRENFEVAKIAFKGLLDKSQKGSIEFLLSLGALTSLLLRQAAQKNGNNDARLETYIKYLRVASDNGCICSSFQLGFQYNKGCVQNGNQVVQIHKNLGLVFFKKGLLQGDIFSKLSALSFLIILLDQKMDKLNAMSAVANTASTNFRLSESGVGDVDVFASLDLLEKTMVKFIDTSNPEAQLLRQIQKGAMSESNENPLQQRF